MTSPRRRFLVPEVVQTSAVDCGPAALKCLLEGFGIRVSYGRLREACQTEVDGTSIDTIEDVARELGLDVEQTMVPLNHLLLDEAEVLPAMVVVRLPNGFTHFVIAWRRVGSWVELMDPATGRRWVRASRFLEEVYIHEHRIAAAEWLEWAKSPGFLRPIARRLEALGAGARAQLEPALASGGWRELAALDAAARLVESLIESRAVKRGKEASRLLAGLLEKAAIPDAFWSVRLAPPLPAAEGPAGGTGSSESAAAEEVILRGAVVLSAGGKREPEGSASLSSELEAALSEPPPSPGRELLRILREDGVLSLGVLAGGLALSAGNVVLEAILLRGAMEVGRDLGLVTQRITAMGAFLLLAVALLLLELKVASGLLRLGRRIETQLRMAFLGKIPRLVDRYFSSRPISDMAERCHSIQQVRGLPRLGGQLARSVMALLVTVAGIAWIDPASAPLAAIAAACSVGLPLLFGPDLQEKDLRLRTHAGALSQYYFDALVGLAAVRAHAAERSLLREHESLLVEWSRAGSRFLKSVVLLEGLQCLCGFGFACLLLLLYAGRSADVAGALLLAYWALSLPVFAEDIALLARQYPIHRNLVLRLVEPLGAPETSAVGTETGAEGNGMSSRDPSLGASVAFEHVGVRAGGHTILEDISLELEPGSHAAIVGRSGAGKSSLVGLLLGWHRPSRGRVIFDGKPLTAKAIEGLRRETVWVDPAVQLWNRTLLSNLSYGNRRDGRDVQDLELARALEEANLYAVVERLPEGMKTPLGEGGGLVSGGEGQRVRLARGFLRPGVRLVILDEPFRGLDREQRSILLDRSRKLWRNATFLCITHDVAQALAFDRVLVLDEGRIVEDGRPAVLAQDPSSRFRSLLDAEEEVQAGLWSSAEWRRLRLAAGSLGDGGRAEA